MKFLIAIALLALALAEATHVPEHTLRGPRFKPGKQYKYDVELNVTAGVLGLSSQVSASILKAEVSIYAKTERELLLKIENVVTSGSVKAIDNKFADVVLHPNRELEDRLSIPIRFTLEDGKVVSYTLSNRENLESKKIKKSILRSLEMYVPESALMELENPKYDIPVTYNTTEDTEFGLHSSRYIIVASPYVDFPAEDMVYNISRIDNFEAERYPAHKLHHNFEKQGCPEVCRKEWRDNEYGAGCPIGYEPHQSPIKTTFSHEHALSAVENVFTPEIINTVEVHVAEMYDQDMEVLIRYRLTRTEVSSESIQEPSGQQTYTDLNDWESEINEQEIDDLCSYKRSDEAVVAAKNLLRTISKTIVEGELSQSKSYLIGEKAILLREALSRLLVEDFKKVAADIKTVDNMKFATDDDKVKRQIWLDILPLVGTQESVKFIVEYITQGIREKSMLALEAKEILEALPENIEKPDSETIRELMKLTKNTDLLRKSTLLHSAIHLTLGKVVGEVCGNEPVARSPSRQKASPWFKSFKEQRSMNNPVQCPESLVSEIVEEVTRKLKEARKPHEIAIYIETLTHTGAQEVLPVITEYVYGTAENMQKFSLRFIDFTKSVAQYALHNIAERYPAEVLEIVMPVYFNETESPKVRNAAFGVLIRCQPSLDILEKVVIRSWYERSFEVGSFVTSTLETFGNSSLPCMQLTSHRIKIVLPQMKRFDVGVQHAKNYMWTYFDDDRDYGLEGRLEYTPNNESYIPSTLYKSLSYTIGSLRDIIFESSLNIEGLTQEKIIERITEYLDIENVEAIEREEEAFGRGESGLSHIQPRTVEDIRFTTYTKFFYKSSYYYLDSTNMRSAARDLAEFFTTYLKKTESRYSGYLVKMLLPSSYHTVAIAKTLPYPVEFEMRKPVILALHIRTAEDTHMPPSPKNFNLHIRPSVYLSKLFTHQMKNIGDCKEIGVYHENKLAITYPFELKYDGMTFPNVTIKYKVPPKSKRILSYYTEAGTYVGKKELEILPLSMEKQPIRTNPTPFKFERNMNLVGVPPVHVELHTEDMNLLTAKLPRNPLEALDLAIRRILNAGWRYKSVNVTVLEDQNLWTGDTEATFRIEYSRKHVPRFTRVMSPQDAQEYQWNGEDEQDSPQDYHWQRQSDDYHKKSFKQSDDFHWQRQSDDSHWQRQIDDSQWGKKSFKQSAGGDEDWSQYLKPAQIGSLSAFTQNARAVSRILNYILPHMTHVLNVSVTAEPLHSAAYFRVEFNHTYERDLYSIHAEAAAKQAADKDQYEITIDHLMGFWNKPDEFNYDQNYGKQQAGFLTAINMPQGRSASPWEQVEIAMRGDLQYESNRNILENELLDRIDEEHFLPEMHDECLRDVREGKPLSEECVKAIREYSIFNKINMDIMWDEELPYTLRQFARKADIYLKHYFFEHMDLKTEKNARKGIHLRMDYIDKLVDEPVLDLTLEKPSETVTIRRLPVEDVFFLPQFTRPLSAIYSVHETAFLEVTNNTYLPSCTLMENYVRTFDLKTFEFHPKDCHYVLSTHCTKRKNFAVILHGTKEIYVHLGTNTIILAPKTGQHYQIKYNGEEKTIVDPVLLHERDEIYVYTETFEREHEHIKVVAIKAGIWVLYDGKNVKIQVSPRYKGELCGLCSEFDGEEVREFRGMDRCLYKDPVDFADSNMVKRDGRCKVERLHEEKMCDGESSRMDKGRDHFKQDGYEPSIERNVVVNKGNEVCFSVHPIFLCEENDQPSETKFENVGFHCLPKRDLTAKKMINEAKWRPLQELERKSVDYVQRIEIAKMC